MRIIGCDLHTRQVTIAMLDTETGEVVGKTLEHEGEEVREFYSALPRPVRVGIEATGSMLWFLNLMEELGIDSQVGHPAKIRAAEPRKQKHDRRDADLLLKLLMENRFPSIWMPSKELRDLRALLPLATDVFLGDAVRFEDAKALASYVGMIPSEYSSAGRQRLGGLSKQGNPLLRFLWCEAAIHAVRRDPLLQRFYRRKLVQKGMGKARVAVARKLGIRLYIMLRDQI